MISFPSFLFQTLCSGNVGKCYSASSLPAVSACKNMLPNQCPAGCKDQLASAGAPASSTSAKCCVKWFQDQAKAPECSQTAAIFIASLMGQDCINFFTMFTPTGQPVDKSMYSTKAFPAPCASKSPAVLGVANCGINTPLADACPQDTATPFVQSSVLAAKKVSTVTINFSSSTLKAMRGFCFVLERRSQPTKRVQVLATKHPETLKAICLWFAVDGLTHSQATVDPSVSAGTVQSITPTAAQDAPQPSPLPTVDPSKPTPVLSSSSMAHLVILPLFLCVALLV
jgi:hypothetical protein